MQPKNPEAFRILLLWLAVAVITLGALALMGFLPPHPGFGTVFLPALVAVFIQGGVAMMAVKRGQARMARWILLVPPLLGTLAILVFFVLFAIGIS